MTPSPRCEAFIKDFEKCARQLPNGLFTAYLPTPNDVPTIGWGSTGPDILMGTIWTQAQCDERFAQHLAVFASTVSRAIGSVPTTQGQFDAMVSLAYNIGQKAFLDSTLLKLHKGGDHDQAANQFARWNKQAGQVLDGLTRRREGEAAMYRGG